MNEEKEKRNDSSNDGFIRFPTVDFCFKELMNTELHRESEDDKLGILDVSVELEDGAGMNMEMQVPYFEFWANRALYESSAWRISSSILTSSCSAAMRLSWPSFCIRTASFIVEMRF